MQAGKLTQGLSKAASFQATGARASRGGLGAMLGAVSPARQAAERTFSAPASKAGLTRTI